MGKADLKVTVGLLVLGLALGAILLRLTAPSPNGHLQGAGRQQGLVRPLAPPRAAVGASAAIVSTVPQEQAGIARQAPPADAAPPPPEPPPPPPPSEALYGAQGTVLSSDLEKQEILIELTGPLSGPPSEAAGQAPGEGPRQTIIQLADTTRLEKMIVGKHPESGAGNTARHEVQLADLRPGDVVRCAYRTETPEALQGVETVSVIVETDLASAQGEAFNAWPIRQSAYIKGRIVSLDSTAKTIDYQGYAFNQVPPKTPRAMVRLRPGAMVYQVEDESQVERAQRPLEFEQLRVGQTILFPVEREALQAHAKTFDTDRLVVVTQGVSQ